MKRYDKTLIFSAFLLALSLTSCSDFFETTPKEIIADKDYPKKLSEIYRGFMGIVNKVQDAGDHAIFLTDTRANVLETTSNAPVALQDIYNYKNTDGNEYADPSCYYAIINSCNDYAVKMGQYHSNTPTMSDNDVANMKALLSCSLRLKVWAYYMLGKIYGQAYWTDKAIEASDHIQDTATFVKCDMGQLATRCINLLEQGFDVDGMHIDGDTEMKWYTWLDENSVDQTSYMKWQYMVPPRILLEASLRSWRASYETEDVAQGDWQWIHDNLLQWLYNIRTAKSIDQMPCPGFTSDDYIYDRDGVTVTGINSAGWVYQCNLVLQNDATYPYYSIFWSETIGNRMQDIAGIMYDYDNGQSNRIVQYFCPEYPDGNSFYLKPSNYGVSLYGGADLRGIDQKMVMNTLNGKNCLTKYYYAFDATASVRSYKYLKDDIFKIEPTILMFRGHDIHFLLAEAENHLGNWKLASAILNNGLGNIYAAGYDVYKSELCPAYESWFSSLAGYGDVGIVGCVNGTEYDLPTPEDDGYHLTEEQRREVYDWALAREAQKEYVGEGKAYPYLCKIAQRYNGSCGRGTMVSATDSVISIIAPKYGERGLAGNVRNSLQSYGYFINWNLDK